MSVIDRVAALLKQTMGLDVASVGSMLIERAIDERTHALGLSDWDSYLLTLQTSPGEMQELIETVIVPETWFFRDREAILAVARMARELSIKQFDRPIRILSLPCSTGEEPYSIAMALLDAGIPTARFKIDAIDICKRSLAMAQRGNYGRNSFRGKVLDYRDRHFSTSGDFSSVSDDVRKQVTFRYGNMFAEDFLQHEPAYDFVFCRNVLIYFDRPMQQQAVEVLDRLLSKQGTIFVGPAEAGIMLRPNFASSGIPLAFAFHRKAVQEVLKPAPKKPAVPLQAIVLPPVIPKKKVAAPKQIAPSRNAEAIMTQAMQCANQGDLAQASTLCKEHQNLVGPSAASFYLMGLIADAQNETAGAMQMYRKTIYLQPNHIEAMTHIAALLAAKGDAAGAQLMQQRAQRVKEQSHA